MAISHGKRSLGGRATQSEPFFHHIQFAKDTAPRHFYRQAAQHQDRSIDPQDWGHRERAPIENVFALHLDMGGVLLGVKGQNQAEEKNHVACQNRSQAHATARQQIPRAPA